MKKLMMTVLTGALMTAAALSAYGADADPTQAQGEMCLACHGSCDALADKTKNWKNEYGEVVQPHTYIDGKAAKAHEGAKLLPDCVGCHGQHPIPPQKDYKFKEPTVSPCYGCHHMENFQRCSASGCHEK